MEQDKKLDWKKELFEWIKSLAFVFISVFILTQFVFVNASIPTGSMCNTIMPNDRIVALRFSYWFSQPKRGDIAVFKFPDDEEFLYVKRVVGTPGDTVEIKNGDVYINGVLNTEINKFVKEQPKDSFGPYVVPPDSYFMMGDNRNDSWDSRFWSNTFVHKDKILGKAVFKYWKGFNLLK